MARCCVSLEIFILWKATLTVFSSSLFSIQAAAVAAYYDCTLDDARTSSQADDGAQALPFPHDDGGQDLAPQQAVLDARCEGVEPLVTQHGDLVVQSAATNRKLGRRTREKC